MATFVGKRLQRSNSWVNGKVVKTFVIFLLLLTSLFLTINSSGGTSEQAVHAQVVLSTSASTAPVPPALEWEKILPNAGDTANCIIQTSDGGYAVVGLSNSKSSGVQARGYLFKLDSSGNMQWNQSYDTGNILVILQTKDGGYVLDGIGKLIKTDSDGIVQWETHSSAYMASMVQTGDGGYALAGFIGDDIADFWLAKVDSTGTMLWNKTYGGTGDDRAYSIVQSNDGGYVLAGKSNSFSVGTEYDFWLVKTDASGNLAWNKTFGAPGGDSQANSVIQTSDGGYVLAGSTYAFGNGYFAFTLLVKTDFLGNIEWARTYSGSISKTAYSYAKSLIQTSDGGLAFTGAMSPSWISPTFVWLVKTDAAGNTDWNETFGNLGPNPELTYAGNSLIETSDGGFAIAGFRQEPGFPWFGSYYVVKTGPAALTPSPPTPPGPSQFFAFPQVTIKADGSVDPSTAPIQRNGILYTFNGNWNGSLLIEKDNIVIDGSGYALQGNGTINGLYIRTSETGIKLAGRINVTIENLQIYNYKNGIYLDNSAYATISGNDITLNSNGIFEINSAFTTISGNNVTQSTEGIVITASSANNKISNNNIVYSAGDGIWLNQSAGNVVSDNNISYNGNGAQGALAGISLNSGSNNLIVGNILYSDFYGISMHGGTNSIIAANNFKACSFGISSYSDVSVVSDNLFYMNDFNNTHPNQISEEGRNSWDNGTVGNYWSDYMTRYPDAKEIDSSGIGDTSYDLNPNNVDHYPLMAPVSRASAVALVQALVSAHSWSPTPTQMPSTNPILLASLALVAVVIVLVAVVVLRRWKKHTQATLSAPS